MFVVGVSVHVKEERIEDFKAAILDNARNTRNEPGNVRFDVMQRVDDPARFFLYECYKTPEDFAAHQTTPHYLAWRDKVQDWMADKRVGVKYQSLFPSDADW